MEGAVVEHAEEEDEVERPVPRRAPRPGAGRRNTQRAARARSASHASCRCVSSSKSENTSTDGRRCSSTQRVWMPYFGPTSSIRSPVQSRPAATSSSPSSVSVRSTSSAETVDGALVADRPVVARQRRVRVELLAVVVHRDVARELQAARRSSRPPACPSARSRLAPSVQLPLFLPYAIGERYLAPGTGPTAALVRRALRRRGRPNAGPSAVAKLEDRVARRAR